MMKYYCVLLIPQTEYKALSSIPAIEIPVTKNERMELMDNGDVRLSNIEISDTNQSLLLNVTLKKVSGQGSIEIKCDDLTLYLKQEDTSQNGLVKYSYEYDENKDRKDPLLNRSGNITHAVYSAIKRFYHIHRFHKEEHDSILNPYCSGKNNVDIESPNNEVLNHYLACYKEMFDNFVIDFKKQSRKIDSIYAMPEGVGRSRSLNLSFFLLDECANALGISSFVKFLLSSKYRLPLEAFNHTNRNIFSDIERELLKSIGSIKEIETDVKDKYANGLQHGMYATLLSLDAHVKELAFLQTDAKKTSKTWNRVGFVFGAIGIISLIITIISFAIALKTPTSKEIEDILNRKQKHTDALINDKTKEIIDSIEAVPQKTEVILNIPNSISTPK